MTQAWPSNLPYTPEREGMKVPNVGLANIESPMQSGNTRSRKQYTLRITGLQYQIIMAPAKLKIFHQFLRDLGDGVGDFTMLVWIQEDQNYQTRTCKIRNGSNGVAEEGHGLTGTRVSFILDVRNL